MGLKPGRNEIVVRGRAKRWLSPDRSSWRIEVKAAAADAHTSFDECLRQSKTLIGALRDALGDDVEIGTDHMRVSPHWDRRTDTWRGYESSTAVTVRTLIDAAADVVQAAVGCSVAQIDGPELEISGVEEVSDELLDAAVANARERAARLAEAAERRLGSALSITEPGLGARAVGRVMSAADSIADPAVLATERAIEVEVIVTFELVD